VARRARATRRRVSDEVDLGAVARALGELAGATVEFTLRPNAEPLVRERFAEVTLALGGAKVAIGVAPDLATALLARVLGRSLALERNDALRDESLLGALGALAVEVARRVSREPVALAGSRLTEPLLSADVTVRVDGKPHAAYVLASDPASLRPETRGSLDELGELEVSLSLVVAVSLATPGELARLCPGTAWLPGEGALVNARGVGRGVLVAPNGERGVSVDLTADGRIVLLHDRIEIRPDESISERGDMAQANGDDTLTDAVLEAPVVVRVELGQVSMPASDWAKLRPGDVIETGQRIAEPVVLRVAGRAVARGELVDVDGELGVRIQELVGEKR
jgi:type III secretion system YscQ/HrcQ family protein